MAKQGNRDVAADLEKFEHFLFEMSDVLEAFTTSALEAGFRLDYSLGSLDALEDYWIASGQNEPHGLLANRAARYLGEVFRKNLGGKWSLCLKNPRYLYYKLPVISEYSIQDIEFCPTEVFGNFARRQQRGLLRRALESHLAHRA